VDGVAKTHEPTVSLPATKRADPIEVFTARCEARAHLVAAGELELHEAVDGLQEAAERTGLVAARGQDWVQAVMAKTFAPIRAADDVIAESAEILAEPPTDDDDEYAGLSSSFARACRAANTERARQKQPIAQRKHRLPVSTITATKYLIQQGDPNCLRKWLAEHSTPECAAIWQYVQRKQR
jgi:hypothetical protein